MQIVYSPFYSSSIHELFSSKYDKDGEMFITKL